MERPQGGCAEACIGVRGLPEEQGGVDSSGKVVAIAPYSRGEMGEHLDGLHHSSSYCAGSLLFYVFPVFIFLQYFMCSIAL